jgi:large subunit ribosomal protein L32e
MIDMSDGEKRRLMRLRKKISQKRPHFRKFESWRLVRIKDYWRKPKGIDNKMRQKRKGWPRTVNVGFRSPKAVRYLHPSGMEEVAVHNVGDLTIVDPETQVARIGRTVGRRKRRAILKEALELNIRVLNTRNMELDEEEVSATVEEEPVEEEAVPEEVEAETLDEEEETPEEVEADDEEAKKE